MKENLIKIGNRYDGNRDAGQGHVNVFNEQNTRMYRSADEPLSKAEIARAEKRAQALGFPKGIVLIQRPNNGGWITLARPSKQILNKEEIEKTNVEYHPIRPVSHRVSFPFGVVYNFSRNHPLAWLTGKRHTGTDYASPSGTPVKSPLPMKITRVVHSRVGYGNRVEARSTVSPHTFLFAHLSVIAPVTRVGSDFHHGQVFAWTGNTGASTAPHLHFEVRRGDTLIDPEEFLKYGR